MAKKLYLDVGPARHEVELRNQTGAAFTMLVNDVEHAVSLEPIAGAGLHRLTVDGAVVEVVIRREPGGLNVAIGPDSHSVRIQRAGAPGSPGGGVGVAMEEGQLAVTAPMTGVVLELFVGPGDAVTQGMPLLVIVAMKMNNEIRSPISGAVKSVHVQPNDSVEHGALLVVLEAIDA
ncbi:MAG: biotin/lipoyl-containing protein [Dehalococcoidia bacterium]